MAPPARWSGWGSSSIDLYYAHQDDPNTPLEETLGAFAALIGEGKIRHAAASNYSAARLSEALRLGEREDLASYVALQPHYNLMERAAYEGELQAVCERHGLACLPYFALARGFLTGKYRRDGCASRSTSPRAAGVRESYFNERGFAVLDVLDAIAAEHDTTVAAVALAWLRAQSDGAGARRQRHLDRAARRAAGLGRSSICPSPSWRGSARSRPEHERQAPLTGRVVGMNRRKLGSSDIEVSEISLGSWLTYSGGVEREQAEACVEAAFDAGINFIDTANVYGRGAAETLLGEVLAGHERSSYVLATKVYFPMSDSDRGLSAAQIHKQIDASLERLQTDYVDLYQCHRYDDETPLEETMAALTEVVQRGQGAPHRLQRVAGGADRRVARAAGRRALGLQPAAVLDAVADARG